MACRFALSPDHRCARRDGRPILPGEDAECHAEVRAQVADLTALGAAVDAAVLPAWGGVAA